MKPVYANIDVHRVRLRHLLCDGNFHKSKTLEMESRLVRELCSLYPEQFFSTQSGYKLTAAASNRELHEAIADLRSRIRHIDERATRLEGVLRDRIGSVTGELFPTTRPH